ncbi:MAG: GYF domain-containing protein [Limisphaerales bacterium]|jgi:hypothetical protein|nr:GYF domain-containing protein [Verrucomicrobiota bacterium]
MYKIIGKDGREYGPIEKEELRSWIFEHRVIEATLVKAEGSDRWVPVCKMPEFADLFSAGLAATPLSGPQPSGSAERPAVTVRKTHPLCIWGFCFSIASCIVCCFGFPLAVAGFVLSLLGLVTVIKEPQYKGKLLAILGLIISFLVLFSHSGYFIQRKEIRFYRPVNLPSNIRIELRLP